MFDSWTRKLLWAPKYKADNKPDQRKIGAGTKPRAGQKAPTAPIDNRTCNGIMGSASVEIRNRQQRLVGYDYGTQHCPTSCLDGQGGWHEIKRTVRGREASKITHDFYNRTAAVETGFPERYLRCGTPQ